MRAGQVRTSGTVDPALTSSGDLNWALARAGEDERVRTEVLEALRDAEGRAEDPSAFRLDVRWPLTLAMLATAGLHRKRLANGLVFEVGPDSRIEQAFLLASEAEPDHVWEPQTTKLIQALAEERHHAIVGGAYIGDHALFLAKALAGKGGQVHAFEPMEFAFRRLLRNADLSLIDNLQAHRVALWDASGVKLRLEGPPALASISACPTVDRYETVPSITIDDYIASERVGSVGIVMLDTEGGEERGLAGARDLLSHPYPEAPDCIFEIHREYVDWSEGLHNTEIVRSLNDQGYLVFAIRDIHGNLPMRHYPIEVIPVDRVYLEGPPHGFNLLATKDPDLVARLRLRTVTDVSPKLLVDRDPALHHPVGGF